MRALPEQQEATGRLDEAPVPFLVNERARPLRAGLGAVRERLDAIIPGYFSLDAYQALHARWFAPAGFWTPARQTWLSVAAAAAIMGVITSFLWQTRRARRRAENITADLRAVNDRLRVVLDTARSAIFGLTRDGRIAFANAGARRLLGLADSPAPQNWPDGARFVDPDSRKPLAPAHSPLRRPAVPGSGAPWHSDILALQRPDDTEPRFVTLSSAPLPDGRADGIASVIVMDDVTDQERARQREERSSRLDALGQLTGGVAHDFNNILATIDYAVQLALPHADDAGRRYLDTAAQSVRRGADLTARLLAFAKRQSGAPGSHRVTDVLAEFRDLAVPAIEERIELLFSAPPEGLHVHCDLPQLENALLNLVLNSRDAIRSSGPGSGGRITLSVREVHDLIDPDIASHGDPVPRRVEFTIADNGPGMTDDVRKRATDPFFTTKPEGAGSGLGLAMVYGFAETSGGTLALYSVPGAGTTVRLTLPAGTPEGNVVAPEHRTPVTVAGHERILLVEDEPALVDLVAETLRALGFDVVTARSGDIALDILQADKTVDLLLSDVVMPGRLDGVALARAARRLYPTLPVVFMSGYTGAVRAEDLAELGVILQKPCARSELARTLRSQLDRAR
ncbi:ATP-binding protein [Salipiger aestuarii]|nr:ATP-binding protein [Salipiger aestuarii]